MITIDIKIRNIFIKKEDGSICAVKRAFLKCESGIEGDKNNDISIISSKTQKLLEKNSGFCCVDKFSCNLIIDKEEFSVGEKIVFNESEIKIVKVGRKCHGICQNSKKGIFCPLVSNSVIAKVTKNGFIEVEND